MLAKHLKELINSIPDNKLILFDDGSGTFVPLQSMVETKVVTEDEPGDPRPEFILEEDLEIDQEYIDTFGVPPAFDAIILSVDPIQEEEKVIEKDDEIQ